jgi:hypothetical protein
LFLKKYAEKRCKSPGGKDLKTLRNQIGYISEWCCMKSKLREKFKLLTFIGLRYLQCSFGGPSPYRQVDVGLVAAF